MSSVPKLAHVKSEDLVFEANVSAGKKAVIRAVLKAANKERKGNVSSGSENVGVSGMVIGSLIAVVYRCLRYRPRRPVARGVREGAEQ